MPASPPEVSPIDNLPRPLAVVAHDAGAANMIASWCASTGSPPDFVCISGPAAAIWEGRFGTTSSCSLEEAIEGAACVLSGTGWASDWEHRARILARGNAHSVAVVDHWVNYAARFERKGETVLPDVVVVGDALAQDIARGTFPDQTIALWPNTYLAEQAAEAGEPPANGDTLFVCEPARSDWGRATQGEFQALDWFAEHGGAAAANVRLRPHPSDPPGKYADWLAAHPGWALDTSTDISAALQGAEHVAGLHSMAMVIALEAGRNVTCAIPPWGPDCLLPHPGIARLNIAGA